MAFHEWTIKLGMLSDEQITQFQSLYKSRFGKEINRKDAYEKGAQLVRLMALIYRPMTEKEYIALQKRRQETGLDIIE